MVPFSSENLNKNYTPKMGHFGFFQLIKKYAETTLLIDEKIISQEAPYTVQQSLGRVKSPKTCANCLKYIFKQRFWVLYTRVDLHTPKMVIIQFHTSSVWKNACHKIFIHFRKKVRKKTQP